MSQSANLDRLTHTFSRDQEFFEELAGSPALEPVCKMIVYVKWWRHSHITCVEGLLRGIPNRFPNDLRETADFWTCLLGAQLAKDVGLVTYLVCRGPAQEAGAVVRRLFENIGLLSHFWKHPEKAAFLGDVDTDAFRKSFVREEDKAKAKALRVAGISKRFDALHCQGGKLMTKLYRLFSDHSVHGGNKAQAVASEVKHNRFWCFFLPRMLPSDSILTNIIELCLKGIEMTTLEYVTLLGHYGDKSHAVTEAGRTLLELLEDDKSPSSRMYREMRSVKTDITTCTSAN
jgi:hypothetical protein